VLEVLNAVYEEDFLGFSYGFQPKRSQHDALDALSTAIIRTRVGYILDCAIEAFFTRINRQ
jgi:retron-type reverse transcriptase